MSEKAKKKKSDYLKFEHVNYETLNDKYEHYRKVEYGEVYNKKIEENYICSFEELCNLDLSNASPSSPVKENEFVMTNYYFIDFWGFILSPKDVQILQMLKRWSYGQDYTVISVTEIAKRTGISAPTVRASLNTLEDNFFIMRFYRRLSTISEGDKKPEQGIYIKLRMTTPLLNKEQIESLPAEIRADHDDYMNRLQNSLSENETIELQSKAQFVNKYIREKCISSNDVDKDISFLIKEHGIEKLAESMFQYDKDMNEEIKSLISSKLSKPAFDTFFKNCIYLFDEHLLTIICQDKFTEEGINESRFYQEAIEYAIENLPSKYKYYNKEYIAKSIGSYYIAKKTQERI